MTESEPDISLAKIGLRYYWVVWRFKQSGANVDDLGVERVLDGFCSTREAATSHALAVLRRMAPEVVEHRTAKMLSGRPQLYGCHKYALTARNHPEKGYAWAIFYHSHGRYARLLYRHHHGKQKAAKNTNAQGNLGSLWTMYRDEDGVTQWCEHPITKITHKRIFVRDNIDRTQNAVDRQAIERDGTWRSGGQWGPHRTTYYSAAAKQQEEMDLARRFAERETFFRGGAYLGRKNMRDATKLLGLTAPWSRSDVMMAFRREVQKHHPDKGGDPATFRRLIEAKDRALAGARE